MYSLFISDSLGLPNSKTKYEDTIPYYLSQKGNVWLISHTGATVSEYVATLAELSKLMADSFFDVAVIQLGLSDCAPRPLAIWWRDILSKLRPVGLRRTIIRGLHRHRPFIQKHIGYFQRTPYDVFKKDFDTLLRLVSSLSRSSIVVLMPPIKDSLEEHSPGLRKEIDRYNTLMKELAGLCCIDQTEELEALPEVYLTNDGHLTKEGNNIILEKIGVLV